MAIGLIVLFFVASGVVGFSEWFAEAAGCTKVGRGDDICHNSVMDLTRDNVKLLTNGVAFAVPAGIGFLWKRSS